MLTGISIQLSPRTTRPNTNVEHMTLFSHELLGAADARYPLKKNQCTVSFSTGFTGARLGERHLDEFPDLTPPRCEVVPSSFSPFIPLFLFSNMSHLAMCQFLNDFRMITDEIGERIIQIKKKTLRKSSDVEHMTNSTPLLPNTSCAHGHMNCQGF